MSLAVLYAFLIFLYINTYMLYMLYTGLCIMCMGGNYHDYLAWVPRQFLRQVLSSFIQDFYFVTLLLPDVCFKWAISCILNHIEQEA